MEENNFEIAFATLVPIPENVARLSMIMEVNGKEINVPLELFNDERKKEEL